MRPRFRSFLPVLPVVILPALVVACGGNNAGTLQSITLSPATAQPGVGGTIQFVATGHFTNPTHSMTPLQVEAPLKGGWSYTANDEQSGKISLTQEGLATCLEPGTYVVAGWAELETTNGPVCNVIGLGGAPCGSIAGTAQLVCPR